MIIDDVLAHLNILELIIVIGVFLKLRNQINKIKCDFYHYLKECEDK